MEYLKLFDFDADYQAFISGEEFVTPNVSYVKDTEIVYYNPGAIIPSGPDYSKEYLTFEAIDDCVFAFSMNDSYYSLDEGKTWTLLPSGIETPTVPAGSKISFKATNPEISGSIGIGNFGVTGRFNIEGNIMSMLYGDEFADKTDLTGWEYCFCFIFGDNDVIDASKLILPATTLAVNCYSSMFENCISLTESPILPAEILEPYCYFYMFWGCKSLNKITMLAKDISANECMVMWTGMLDDNGNEVSAVSPTGTFIKSLGVDIPIATSENGYTGIPDGWTVEFILPNNIIMNGWNELYPDVEAFNLVNNTDVDIVFNDYDSGDINLNAYSKINIMPDKYTNLRTQSQFVCDILLSGEDNNIVIMDCVYRNEYWSINRFINTIIDNKYDINEIMSWDSISIVIKKVINDGILPNGWNDLYEDIKPFTIVNKTNGERCMFNNDSGESVFEINVNEECNIDDFDTNNLKPGNEFKIDILLSNNSENIVIFSESWNYNETFNDLGERINADYNNLLSNFNNFSIVIYDEIEPK